MNDTPEKVVLWPLFFDVTRKEPPLMTIMNAWIDIMQMWARCVGCWL